MKIDAIHTTGLPGSDHRHVELALGPEEDGDRLARLTFYGDGQDISLYMMLSDAVRLGEFLRSAE